MTTEAGGGDVLKIYDISMMIHERMMIYKNDEAKRPHLTSVKELPADTSNESSITMNLHTGTHIDAHYHMDENGDTIEKLDLARLMTKCRVIDMTQVREGISREDIKSLKIERGDFVLFKTANSFSEEFSAEFIYLKKSGAQFLAEQGVSGVGIDSLGIERNQPNHETHKALMDKDIIIIEGLRLKDVPEDSYLMCALPLKIKGADGAPARVVLLSEILKGE